MGRPPTSLLAWDHPRSRGVYLGMGARAALGPGSSPLARGLRFVVQTGRSGRRIIPARAGFTRPRPGRWCQPPDHPRSRGVYDLWRGTLTPRRGSSPLARGLPRLRGPQALRRRIIPARAGFTSPGARRRSGPWDHPRSRGVYYRPPASVFNRLGSSPLARGLPPRIVSFGYPKRIIPARAGFT